MKAYLLGMYIFILENKNIVIFFFKFHYLTAYEYKNLKFPVRPDATLIATSTII